MGRRDGNGGMQDELVDIVWASIFTPRPHTPTPPPTPLPSTGATPHPTPSTTPTSTPPPIPSGTTPPSIPIEGGQAIAKKPELAARPCEELRRRLRELKSDGAIHERLRIFRRENVTVDHVPGRWWLITDDIALAVAAVASAITNKQNIYRGFSIPSFQSLDNTSLKDDSVPVPRFCRPMMFPVWQGQHLVLALVQMNRDGELSISILDSMFSFLTAGQRQAVFEKVMEAVQYTQWWRWRYNVWEDVPRPTAAQWIPCAQQPTESECGYYAIIFAWSLALGLELNPHAAPIWDDSMFMEVLDIAHLARLGLVDWTLIHNFLRCHRFVLDGAVPEDRRFEQSVQLLTAAEWDQRSRDLYNQEIVDHFDAVGSININNILGNNFIQLPPGLDHTSNSFLSVGNKGDRDARAELSESGRLRFGTLQRHFRLLERHYVRKDRSQDFTTNVGVSDGSYFRNSLKLSEGTINETNSERLFIWYRAFLANKRVQREDEARFEDEPCVLASEGLHRLRYLLGQPDIISTFANAIPDANPGRTLDLGEINLAIAAVVEAIDQRQATLHRGDRNTFAGGFALATSGGIEIAKASPTAGAVSRPRRCLFLPILITSDEIALAENKKPPVPRLAHNFLAVVQEEPRARVGWNNDPSHFVVYTFDSAPDRFKSSAVQTVFHNTVRNIATNLGWHEQRNDDQAHFRRQHTQVDVFRQGRNGWQCGLHVILNSWILALGLIPTADQVIMDEVFYNDLWLLIRSATAGLLDWQTLVAWLFCKGVTTLRTLDAVPEDRRFELSRHQDAQFDTYMGRRVFEQEGDLVNRVREMSNHDMMNIAFQSEEALPYERGNNIVIPGQSSGWESSKAKQGDPTKETGGGETKMTIDDLHFEPGSREYRTAQLCTEEQLETLLARMAGVDDNRGTTFIALAMSMGIEEADEGFEEGSNEGSNGESVVESSVESEELDRAFDNCGVPRRGGLKRKADVRSEGSCHDGSFSTPRKRCKLSCSSSSRRVLRSCVDADGDVRMG